MEIKELSDYKLNWNIAYKENNLDLLEYVVDVANRFNLSFDGIDFSPSEAPIRFNNRYIESKLDLRERYNRMCSMEHLKNCSWDDYLNNYQNKRILDTSFIDKFQDKQLQNTIEAYGLDVNKFWYLILFVNDYVNDLCVDAIKTSNPLIDELNKMNEKLSDATEIIFKKDGRQNYSTNRKRVVDILKIAMQHFIHNYNSIIENPQENGIERLNEIGLNHIIKNVCELNHRESVTIDISYRQYKFAEMMLWFLKDKKGTTPSHIKEKVYKEKHFFVSMLLYVVGLYEEEETLARNKWYEPYYNDKDNRNLSNLVRNYKNRAFPDSSLKIYWT